MQYVKSAEVFPEGQYEATAVIRLTERMEVLSSAPLNGGHNVTDTLFIMQVPHDFHDPDYIRLLESRRAKYGLPRDAVGFMTAAEVKYVFSTAEAAYGDVTAYVAATAGVTNCVEAGAELDRWTEREARSQAIYKRLIAGTINVIAVVPRPLTTAAKVNLLMPLVEAKALAMRDLGYHETGTTSDAAAVVSPVGEPRERFAGTGVPLGIAVARGVREAVAACVRKRGEGPEIGDALVQLAGAGVTADQLWECASALGLEDSLRARFAAQLAAVAANPDICSLVQGALAMEDLAAHRGFYAQDGEPEVLADGTFATLIAGRIAEERGSESAVDLLSMRPLKDCRLLPAAENAAYGLAAGVVAGITGVIDE